MWTFQYLGPPPPPLPPPLKAPSHNNNLFNQQTANQHTQQHQQQQNNNNNSGNDNGLSGDSDSGMEVVEEPSLRPSDLIRGNHNRSMSIISGEWSLKIFF